MRKIRRPLSLQRKTAEQPKRLKKQKNYDMKKRGNMIFCFSSPSSSKEKNPCRCCCIEEMPNNKHQEFKRRVSWRKWRGRKGTRILGLWVSPIKLLLKSETPSVVKTQLEVRMSHFALLLLLLQPHSHNGWQPISDPPEIQRTDWEERG